MESVHVKFIGRIGQLNRRFTLKFNRDEDVFQKLLARLSEYGYSTSNATLVWIEADGNPTIVDSCEALLEAVDAISGSPMQLQLLKTDYSSLRANDINESRKVYVRFKDGELSRRFSLQITRDSTMFENLIDKLRECGYESNGRILVAAEDDGCRTVVDDSESLSNVLEARCSNTNENLTLELEFYMPNGEYFERFKGETCNDCGERKSEATLTGSQFSNRTDPISSDSESFSRISRPESALEQSILDNDIQLQQLETTETFDRSGRIESKLRRLEKKVDELTAKVSQLCHQR